MSPPSQAREAQARQRRLALLAVVAILKLLDRKASIVDLAKMIAGYQVAAARLAADAVEGVVSTQPDVVADAFGGITALGYPLTDPLVTILDSPTPQIQSRRLARFVQSEVSDASRGAAATVMAASSAQGYVRVLQLPSCSRCTILAGRVYRWTTGFDRHPGCDCAMFSIEDLDYAKAEGFVADPSDAFDRGQVTGLSEAEREAISHGADMAQVVNAHRGMSRVGVQGDSWSVTAAGTSRRGVFGREETKRGGAFDTTGTRQQGAVAAYPIRQAARQRLMPGQIIANAEGLPDDLRRQYVIDALKSYGFIH